MPVELSEVTMLMSEHASVAVHTLLRVVEGPAVLGLKLFVVRAHRSTSELLLTMGEATLCFVATFCCLNPVLAEFRLILSISVVFL